MSSEGTLAAADVNARSGYIIMMITTLLWASSGILMSYMLAHYPLTPLALGFWRLLLAGSVLLVALLIFRPAVLRVGWSNVPFLLVYGLLGMACVEAAWCYSVAYNGAAVATVLAYTGPAIVAVASWKLFGESLGSTKIIAVVLSLLGCALVAQLQDLTVLARNPVGTAVGLGTGLGFAAFSLFGKVASKRMNPWATSAYIFAIAAVGLFVAQPFAGLWTMNAMPVGWGLLVFLAVVPTLLGDGLYIVGLGHLPASVATLIISLEPALTAVLAFVLLREVMTPLQMVGGAIITGAVVVLHLGSEKEPIVVALEGVH